MMMTDHNDGHDDITLPTFRFHRYRAELERRQQQEGKEPIDKEHERTLSSSPQVSSQKEKQQQSDNEESDNKSYKETKTSSSASSSLISSLSSCCIENLSNKSITINNDGKVMIQSTDDDVPICNNIQTQDQQEQILEKAKPVLIRNLTKCQVIINISLPALHIVDLKDTTLITMQGITSSIHVTNCSQQSELFITKPAQQLRIHQSCSLNVYLGRTKALSRALTRTSLKEIYVDDDNTASHNYWWKPGSIIMEHCNQIMFVVPSIQQFINAHRNTDSTMTSNNENLNDNNFLDMQQLIQNQTIIKDFQWLRKGVHSPHFSIIQEVFNIERDTANDKAPQTAQLQQTEVLAAGHNAQLIDAEEEEDDDDDDEL